MDVLEFVVPELGHVGLIVDEIFQMELVVDHSSFYGVGWHLQGVQFIGAAEIEIAQYVLLLEHQLTYHLYYTHCILSLH